MLKYALSNSSITAEKFVWDAIIAANHLHIHHVHGIHLIQVLVHIMPKNQLMTLGSIWINLPKLSLSITETQILQISLHRLQGGLKCQMLKHHGLLNPLHYSSSPIPLLTIVYPMNLP
jgi:hypothetical protein